MARHQPMPSEKNKWILERIFGALLAICTTGIVWIGTEINAIKAQREENSKNLAVLTQLVRGIDFRLTRVETKLDK